MFSSSSGEQKIKLKPDENPEQYRSIVSRLSEKIQNNDQNELDEEDIVEDAIEESTHEQNSGLTVVKNNGPPLPPPERTPNTNARLVNLVREVRKDVLKKKAKPPNKPFKGTPNTSSRLTEMVKNVRNGNEDEIDENTPREFKRAPPPPKKVNKPPPPKTRTPNTNNRLKNLIK